MMPWISQKLLRERWGVEILACVETVQHLHAHVDVEKFTLAQIEANIIRCPDPAVAESMIALIEQVRAAGDSVGGVIVGVARGVPAGWGEPVFDSQRDGRDYWDGMYLGKLQPMGNYVYEASVKINATGEEKAAGGNLSMIW